MVSFKQIRLDALQLIAFGTVWIIIKFKYSVFSIRESMAKNRPLSELIQSIGKCFGLALILYKPN